MLRFVLLQNRAGKTRLSKYYTKFSEEETRKIEAEVHRIVTQREGANASAMCSFVEVRRHPAHHQLLQALLFALTRRSLTSRSMGLVPLSTRRVV